MLPLLVVSATGLVAVGLIGALLATARTTARIEQQLRGVVEVIAQSNYPLTDSVLRQMAGLANAELLLTDGAGRRLASSDDLRLPDNDWLAATASTIDAVRLGPALSVGSESLMHSSFLLRREARDEPSRVLHVFFATRDYEAAWQSAFLPPLLVGLSMIGLLAGIVHVTAGRLSRTLAKLGIEVQRLSSGDFSAVEMPAWNDETRDLAGAVNETARRLAEYEAQLRSSERLRTVSVLGAGLAHEMRNAATGCRLAIDLHAARSAAGPEDDSLRVARRQLLVMEDRLREVLLLGKESSALDRHPFDLGDLVTGAAAALEPAAAHAGVLVHSEMPTRPIMIRANRELVRLAVSNVMLNGLQASAKACVEKPVAGRVQIRLESIEHTALLVITDSGAGPSETVAERLFDPLCTTKAEGIGLGLAIAKQAVESSCGRIEWARIDGTTEFRIELPLMSEENCHG